MTRKEHAKLFGIFAWVYAGLLGFSLLAATVSLINFTYGTLGDAARLPRLDEIADSFNGPYYIYSVLVIGIVLFILLAFAFMLAALIANIRLGKKLRSQSLPTKRSIVVASALSLISSIFGGLMTLPFGSALFVYGLWFAFSGRGNEPAIGERDQHDQSPIAG